LKTNTFSFIVISTRVYGVNLKTKAFSLFWYPLCFTA